jgi:tetratricopeptide (TPR) repeat protein
MKHLILSINLLALASLMWSQSQHYYQSMGQNLSLYANAQTVQDWQNIANQFERIAQAEKTTWLPWYYASQACIFATFSETDKSKIDAHLDQAQKYLDNALKFVPNESELYVLQGFLHQSRISVDFMGRGMQYSQLAAQSFTRAKELNPENPRIYYLEAMMVLNTPEMFGGGKSLALPIFKQAKEKFDKFEPSFPLAPNWGREHNQQQMELCLKQQ